jgi:hypothetical protein
MAGGATLAAAAVAGADLTVAGLEDPRPTLPVLIDGRGPFHLVADSAAEGLALSRGVADALNLSVANRPTTLIGSTGTALQGARLATHVDSGDLHWSDIPAVILDRHALAIADGIIGLAGLKGLVARYQFASRTAEVRARDPNAASASKSGARSLHLPVTLHSGGIPSIALRCRDVPGKPKTVVALIDTGAEKSVGNANLAALAARTAPDQPRRNRTLTGSSGTTVVGFDARIEGLAVESIAWPPTSIAFADLPVFRDLGLEKAPALLLGVDLLGQFGELSVDSQRREVRVGTRV